MTERPTQQSAPQPARRADDVDPGTLTLEVDEATSTLYVHALDVGSGEGALDATRASIARLAGWALMPSQTRPVQTTNTA